MERKQNYPCFELIGILLSTTQLSILQMIDHKLACVQHSVHAVADAICMLGIHFCWGTAIREANVKTARRKSRNLKR